LHFNVNHEWTFPNLTTDHTDNTDEEMIHEELSREIIGAAMEVLNELKPYRGELIGNLIPDLIVDDAGSLIPRWSPASPTRMLRR